MLAWTDRDREVEIGTIPPRQGIVTVEKLAVNAVMAGCRPEYFPVVLAATEAMLDERFNLYAVQCTTHPCAPLLILNGPIARELDVNSRYNAFGPGCRANATIGRAVRLILQNVGGGTPGVLDRATQGQPAKYSYCIAEDELENPWSPLHVERGFDPATSTVTVCGAENPHNLNDHVSTASRGILTMIALSGKSTRATAAGRGVPRTATSQRTRHRLASSGAGGDRRRLRGRDARVFARHNEVSRGTKTERGKRHNGRRANTWFDEHRPRPRASRSRWARILRPSRQAGFR
jgi:hypothetical protein